MPSARCATTRSSLTSGPGESPERSPYGEAQGNGRLPAVDAQGDVTGLEGVVWGAFQ